MKDWKVWNVIAWISFVLAIITTVIYFFVDDSYTESPSWIIASILAWYYSEHLQNKANDSNNQNS